MTEQDYREMLLTAAMQIRLATAAVRDSVDIYAEHIGAISSGTITAGHVSASWLEFRDHVHLSIAGTDDVYDWVQNLDANQAKIGELSCHNGFLRSANLLRAEMICTLRFPLGKPIVIGGHSAGGAISEVMAALMPNIEWREIVTFGAPRVWSAATAPIIAAKNYEIYRFVVPGDPVPALPFRRFRRLFGKAEYSHASQPLELSADGRVLLDRGNSSLRKAVRLASGCWLYGLASVGMVRQWVPTLLSRHSLLSYRERILSAVARVETK